MATSLPSGRLAQLILPERLAALRAAPALGPALLFFSGGTALRPLCRKLKLYTHCSIHVITPFDSGGSSAAIRRAFDMLSVGDLRNRLLALADEVGQKNGALYRLFSYRLSKEQAQTRLNHELRALAEGTHPLMRGLPETVREPIQNTLRFVVSVLPRDLDLKGANIGNLVLAGIFISHDRDIDTALSLVSKMLDVLGKVMPSSEANAQLAVQLQSGASIVGQHRITGKEAPPIASPINNAFLTASFDSLDPIEVPASAAVLQQLADADLICYPYGSFYSSVMANLLPRGIGRAIAAARCPKVYVPNWGSDPEQLGMSLADTVERLIEQVRREVPEASVRDVLHRVVVDTVNLDYSLKLDLERIEALGIEVLDLPFAELFADRSQEQFDFTRLAEILVSLS